MTLKRGQYVWVTYDRCTLVALVAMASPNGHSAVLMFDGILGGYVGAMAVLAPDDSEIPTDFVDLLNGGEVVITPYPS